MKNRERRKGFPPEQGADTATTQSKSYREDYCSVCEHCGAKAVGWRYNYRPPDAYQHHDNEDVLICHECGWPHDFAQPDSAITYRTERMESEKKSRQQPGQREEKAMRQFWLRGANLDGESAGIREWFRNLDGYSYGQLSELVLLLQKDLRRQADSDCNQMAAGRCDLFPWTLMDLLSKFDPLPLTYQGELLEHSRTLLKERGLEPYQSERGDIFRPMWTAEKQARPACGRWLDAAALMGVQPEVRDAYERIDGFTPYEMRRVLWLLKKELGITSPEPAPRCRAATKDQCYCCSAELLGNMKMLDADGLKELEHLAEQLRDLYIERRPAQMETTGIGPLPVPARKVSYTPYHFPKKKKVNAAQEVQAACELIAALSPADQKDLLGLLIMDLDESAKDIAATREISTLCACCNMEAQRCPYPALMRLIPTLHDSSDLERLRVKAWDLFVQQECFPERER